MTNHPGDAAARQARVAALLAELGEHLAARWPAEPQPIRGQPACQTCRAWDINPDHPTSGLCRRAHRTGDRPWSVTRADEWCDDYRPPDLVTLLYAWTREPIRWVSACKACAGTGTQDGGPCGACDGRGRHLTVLGWWLAELSRTVLPYLAPDVLASREGSS